MKKAVTTGVAIVLLTGGAAYAQRGGGGGAGGTLTAGPGVGQSAVDRQVAALEEATKAEMDAFDTDKNGTISLEEYQARQISGFGNLDADKDGKVTREELQAAGVMPRGSNAALDGDTNRDNAISREEFAANLAREYKTIDKNWDNKITLLELTTKVRNDRAAGRGGAAPRAGGAPGAPGGGAPGGGRGG